MAKGDSVSFMKILNEIKYLSKLAFSNTPVELVYPVTYRCNSRCAFCSRYKLQDMSNELDVEKMSEIFKDLKGFGVVRVTLTGGEPLIRPDIMEILKRLDSMGMKTVLNTNGVLLDEKNIRRLGQFHSLSIAVSFDTMDRATYARLRGTDHLDMVIDNVKKARRICKDMPIRLHMVMTEINMEEVDDIIGFAKDNGLTFSCMPYNHMSSLEARDDELIIKDERRAADIMRHLGSITHLRMVSGFKVIYEMAAKWIEKKDIGLCSAGKDVIFMNVDGRVAPCANMAYFGDLKGQKIKDIYRRSKWEDGVRKCCNDPICFVGCFWALSAIKRHRAEILADYVRHPLRAWDLLTKNVY